MKQNYENRYMYRRIFEAAERSVEDLKDIIAAEKISLTITNGAGQTLAHIAAKHDNVDVLKYLLSEEPDLLEQKDVFCCSVLHLAVVRNSIKSVRYLVEELDADICYLGGQYKDRTALHAAVEFNHLEILKFFVEERNIDFNVPNPKQRTPPIFLTVRHRNWDVIEYLIEEKDANVKIQNYNNENILFLIVRENFIGFLKYLLDERKIDFDVDWRNSYGESIVHLAAKYGRLEILEYLVEKKFAYINAQKSNDKRTPLHFAALHDDYAACKFLVEHGANPCARDNFGDTPADKAKDDKVIEYLEKAIKTRQPRSAPLPYSLVEAVVPLSLESRTPQESIAHTSGSASYNEEVKSFPSGNTNLTSFQNLLFLATSMTRTVRGGQHSRKAESFPSPTSIIQSRMSLVAIDAIDADINFRKF